jgi:hypothetical protein
LSQPFHIAIALAALSLAGCYRAVHPTDYACSAAEPLCPEGLVCNGTRCVAGLGDARGADRTLSERSADGRKPCSSWAEWTCDWDVLGGTGTSTCGDRTLVCNSADILNPACTCRIGSGAPASCQGPFDGVLLCDDICPNAFSKGCCKP